MSTTTTDTPWIKPAELADRWGLDHKTVLDAAARGEIVHTKIGRKVLIPRCWVEARERGLDTADA